MSLNGLRYDDPLYQESSFSTEESLALKGLIDYVTLVKGKLGGIIDSRRLSATLKQEIQTRIMTYCQRISQNPNYDSLLDDLFNRNPGIKEIYDVSEDIES